ncbi:nucleotidyltransferase family protein [uncultured Ruminococcus sp.]|uniref:nucleotidyltransferase family protein n=1 Tax=uncultured Ruminococcus sp. TaxID=165186 RepID=UPI002622316B|nr:nucleotidyltransferase domain-containing protein [uncultured Ruminococcus sp.]
MKTKNEIYTPQQIQTILEPIFLHYHVKKAILFGSYAKGMANEHSDIDILVDSGLKGLAFFGLLEDVVDSLGKDVDLLDVTQIIPDSEIETEIMKSGVAIYGS